MPLNEELQEHAEHAHEPFDKMVAASMAVIAALLALVSVGGQLTTTEELLAQQKASDQWAYYQAKSIRRYQSEVARDLLLAGGPANAAQAQKYGAQVDRYRKDGDAIQEKATEFERESESRGRQAHGLHIGEVFLEIAIVFCSLAILARKKIFWSVGIASGALGALLGMAAIFVLK